jgi:Ca2+-binding RTX toxin-like protein
MANFGPFNPALPVTVRLDTGALVNATGGTLADLGDLISDTFSGGDGNDHFVAGASNDTLFGSLGSDTMRGGDGNDTIRYTSADQIAGDVIDGGAGTDVLIIAGPPGVYDFTTATFAGTSGPAIEQILGSGPIKRIPMVFGL